MNETLRDWLLTCPQVKRVSSLAIDAANGGLLDLRDAIASAVATDVRMEGIVRPRRPEDHAYHRRMARHGAFRRQRCTARLAKDTVVLAGALARDVGISQGRTRAALHVRRKVPMTVVTAMPGRTVDEIVEIGRLRLGRYRIAWAEQDDSGLTLWFGVPRLPLETALGEASGSRP